MQAEKLSLDPLRSNILIYRCLDPIKSNVLIYGCLFPLKSNVLIYRCIDLRSNVLI